MQNTKPDLLTASAAATYLNVSRRTLYTRTALGHIPVIRMGGRLVRFDREDLDAYVARCKQPAACSKKQLPPSPATYRHTPNHRA